MEQITQLLPEQVRDFFLVVPFIFALGVCLVSGRILVGIKKFNNDYIPLTLAIWGAIWYTGTAFQLNQDYRAKLWWVNAAIGFVVGYASTGVHQHIERSKFLSNLPILKLLVPTPAPETKPTEEQKP